MLGGGVSALVKTFSVEKSGEPPNEEDLVEDEMEISMKKWCASAHGHENYKELLLCDETPREELGFAEGFAGSLKDSLSEIFGEPDLPTRPFEHLNARVFMENWPRGEGPGELLEVPVVDETPPRDRGASAEWFLAVLSRMLGENALDTPTRVFMDIIARGLDNDI